MRERALGLWDLEIDEDFSNNNSQKVDELQNPENLVKTVIVADLQPSISVAVHEQSVGTATSNLTNDHLLAERYSSLSPVNTHAPPVNSEHSNGNVIAPSTEAAVNS